MVHSGTFQPMKDGARHPLQKKDLAELSKELTSIGAKLELEKPMVVAVNDALKNAPSERTAFLATAVSQMEEKLNEVSAGLVEQIAQTQPTTKELEDARAAAGAK